MRFRINGHFWRYEFRKWIGWVIGQKGRHYKVGECDFSKRQAVLKDSLRGQELCEIACHETRHIQSPEVDEDYIVRQGKELSNVICSPEIFDRIASGLGYVKAPRE